MATFAEALHALADETGDFAQDITTASGTVSTLICATFDNSNLSSSEDEDVSILLESGNNAGQQRFVRRGGLDITTGEITFAEDFSNGVASGVSFSAYGRMPALSRLGGPSLQKGINRGHRHLWVEDQITFTGVSQQKHYPIDTTTYPWFTDKACVIAVYQARTNSDDVLVPLRSDQWDWEWVGRTYNLVLRTAPWNTGQTGIVQVYRPANSVLKLNAQLRAVLTSTAVTSVTVEAGGSYSALPTITPSSGSATFTAVMTATPGPITSVTVNTGGTYTAGNPPALTVTRHASDTGWANQSTQTAGLVTITDESLADVDDVAAMGKAFVYDQLAKLHAPGQTVEVWQAMADRAFAVASKRPAASRGSNRRTGVANLRPVVVVGGRR